MSTTGSTNCCWEMCVAKGETTTGIFNPDRNEIELQRATATLEKQYNLITGGLSEVTDVIFPEILVDWKKNVP